MITLHPRLTEDQVWARFAELGLVVEGHCRLRSGKHTAQFINLRNLKRVDPDFFKHCCHELAVRFLEEEMDYVIGLATVGADIAPCVAGFLSALKPGLSTRVDFLQTQKNELPMQYLNDAQLEAVNGARVLVTDDVLNHGTTYRNLMQWLKSRGVSVRVVGFGTFWIRGDTTSKELRNMPPIQRLVHKPITDWDWHECPLCREGVPLINPKVRPS